MPRTTATAPCLRAKSTISPEKVITSTLAIPPTEDRSRSTRSSVLNMNEGLRDSVGATISRSNSLAARVMMSRWPLVTGSNRPGYIAVRKQGLLVVHRDAGVPVAAGDPRRERPAVGRRRPPLRVFVYHN